MSERQQALAEAYRRNIMKPEQREAYEEAMRRGLVEGPERSLGQRFMDQLGDIVQNPTFAGVRSGITDAGRVARGERTAAEEYGGFFPDNPFRIIGQGIGTVQALVDREGFGQRAADMVTDERARRQLYDARAKSDPIKNPLDFGAFVAGQLVAGIADPVNLIGGGRGVVQRISSGAAINAAGDAFSQTEDISAGVTENYSVGRTAGAAVLGGVIQGGFEGARPLANFVRDAFTRKIDVPTPDLPPRADGTASQGIEIETPAGTVDVPRAPTATSSAALTQAASPTPAPVLPDFASVQPIARDTFLGRQKARIDEKGLPSYMMGLTQRGYTAIIDDLHPIVRLRDQLRSAEEAITGQPVNLRPSQDPLKLARGRHDVANIGHMDIVHGVHPVGSPLTPSTPSLQDVMVAATARDVRVGGKVEDGLAALGKYAAARRSLAEWDNFQKGELQNRPTVEERADIEAFVARLDQERPELKELSDNVNLYAEGLLKKKLDAGLVDRATFDKAMAARDFYVPLKRAAKDKGARVGARTANKDSAVKAYRGITEDQAAEGNTDFLDPIQVLIEETYRVAQRVRQNELNRSLVGMATRLDDVMRKAGMTGDNGLIRKVDRPVSKIELGDGISGDLFDDLPDAFRTGEVNDAGRAIIYVWNDGKKDAYELLDPEWSTEVFDALNAMNKVQSDVVINAISAATTFVSRTVTRDPAFLFANFIRDAMSAWVMTDLMKPFEGIRGVADELTGSDNSRLYNLGGGISGGESSANVNAVLRQRDGTEITRRFGMTPDAFVRRYANWRGSGRAVMDAVRLTELTETGTRRTIFVKAMARAKKEGMTDEDALREAAYVARDYADFGRHGSQLWAARRVVTFLNPAIQGLDKTLRVAIADPASAVGRAYAAGGAEAAWQAILRPLFRQNLDGVKLRNEDKAALKLAVHAWTRMTIAYGGFGLALSAVYADDPDYQQANDKTRATHWIVPVADGTLMRIPKPFEQAFFSNLIERAYEGAYKDDPKAMERMWKGQLELFAPPTGVPFLDAVTGVVTGVDPQSGRDIVPAGTENQLPEAQFNTWTSQMSKGIADGLAALNVDIAPAKIDFLIRTLGGPIGSYFSSASNITDPDRPAGRWTDAPVARRFFSPSFMGSQDKRDFFERAGANTSKLKRTLATMRAYENAGDLERSQTIFDELDEPGKIYVMSQRGEAKTDRLNPLNRAEAFGTTANRLIGEMNGAAMRGLNARPLPEMTARRRQMVIDALERLVVAEMGNAMIATKQPGFEQKNIRDRAALFDELETMSPETARELEHRLSRGDDRAYDYDAVMELWPQVEARLREEGTNADLEGFARQAGRRSRVSTYDRRGGNDDAEPMALAL